MGKKNKIKSASGALLWREILPVSDAGSVAPHEAHLMGAQQNSYQGSGVKNVTAESSADLDIPLRFTVKARSG